MTNVLVCIKRVPDAAGEVLLTADEQASTPASWGSP